MDTGDPGAVRSTLLMLHEAEVALRERAGQRVRHALQIGTLHLAGYTAVEIHERLGLTADEFKQARAWLAEAIKVTST